MFVGSFHRVVNKEDIGTRIPISSSPCIIYVESEKKLYEKNTYGAISEYLSLGLETYNERYDYTPEITDLEGRVYSLEEKIKKMEGVMFSEI